MMGVSKTHIWEIQSIELAKDTKVDFSNKNVLYIKTVNTDTNEIYKECYELHGYPEAEKGYRLDRLSQIHFTNKKDKKCLI